MGLINEDVATAGCGMTGSTEGGTLGLVTAVDVIVTADNGQVTSLVLASPDVVADLLAAWHNELVGPTRGLVTAIDRDGDSASWPAFRILSIATTPHPIES